MARSPLYYVSESHPLGQWARRDNLPCCTLVACIIAQLAGRAPVEQSVSAYSGVDAAWWSRANVWDRSKPWSSVNAARERVGGRWSYEDAVGEGESELVDAPHLTPGRWHVIQRWRGLELGDGDGPQDDRVEDGATGHTYLVYCDTDGSCTVVQSSVAHGLRIDAGGSWSGTAGLDGYAVAVLTLPPHIPA